MAQDGGGRATQGAGDGQQHAGWLKFPDYLSFVGLEESDEGSDGKAMEVAFARTAENGNRTSPTK